MTDTKKDRVWDLTTSTGLGSYTLAVTPPTGWQSFAAFTDGQTLVYTVVGRTSGAFEVVRGTKTGTTLSRTTWLSGSTGAFVNWGAETKDVMCAPSSTQIPTSDDLSYALRVDVASAGTCDIAAAASNYVNITGTTTITAFANPTNGISTKLVRFAAATPLTYSSALLIGGGASVTTTAGQLGIAFYEGSSVWSLWLFPSGPAVAADVRTGTDNSKFLTSKVLFDAAAMVSVAYSSTITLDLTTGLNFEIAALTGNLTLANPSAGITAGRSGSIGLLQDGTGSRTLTLGSYWKCAGGAPTLSTAAGTQDTLFYEVIDATHIRCSLAKAFA